LDMKEMTAHTGAGDIPALIVGDSTAAAATWLDMARYIQRYSRNISYIPKIYARGGLINYTDNILRSWTLGGLRRGIGYVGHEHEFLDSDDDILTPTEYSPPTQQPIWPTAHTAHSQHCGHTVLPPGQKTNPCRRADPTQTQTVYAHPFRRAQTLPSRVYVATYRNTAPHDYLDTYTYR